MAGNRYWLAFIISVIFILRPSLSLFSNELTHQEHSSAHDTEKKFNAKEFLFDHISDAHEWHILSFKDYQLSLSLPVILISRDNGFVVFPSKKLHHGHSAYNCRNYTYKLELEGEKKGKIIEYFDGEITGIPIDLSITKNIVALFFSILLILWVFLSVARLYKRNKGAPPTGIQSFIEPLIIFVRDDIAKQSIGEKSYEKFTPYLLSIFFFIWFNNMLGIVPIPPGGANLSGNIAVTGVLAFFTLITTNISGNKDYWKHIFNTPGVPVWLKIPPLMPLIELFGIFTKPIVLMIRLFANITAGHLITLGFLSLIFVFGEKSLAMGFAVTPLSILFLLFMMFLELLVAFIQAYVFTFLSALYIGMAVEENH